MESCQRLIRTYISTERDDEIQEIVKGISAGQFTLLLVVKSLQEYLTSENEKLRSKGMDFLSTLLSRCPPETINLQSAHVLTSFYCTKLEDFDTVIPALKGLVSLTALPTFGSQDALATTTAIIQHVKMKSHVQSTRYIVFKILDVLMTGYRKVLLDMGNEFLAGYISLADGEKDPRNLLLSFSITKVILTEFDISSHVDNLFDITFCYFPISFKAPADDPYGITPEQLKISLRSCLSATPRFGPLALPFFIDKLSSSVGHTKRDTLQTLEICLPVYGSSVARAHATQLWESFQIEIFQPADPETEALALKASQSLILTLYPPSSNEKLDGLITDIVNECLKALKEPEKNQAQHGVKVLGACIATTPAIRHYALSSSIPPLITLFLSPTEILNRPSILLALTGLVSATRPTPEASTIMEEYKEQVLSAFISGLKGPPATRLPALAGLLQLVETAGLLEREEMGYVVHSIDELLIPGVEEVDELRNPSLDVLSAVSQRSPQILEETTLPLLFTSLPDTAPAKDAESERSKYRRILSYLSVICIHPNLFDILVIRVTTKLELIFARQEGDGDKRECNAAYAYSLLSTLQTVLVTKVERGHVDVQKYVERFVPKLYELFFESAFGSKEGERVGTDSRLIGVAAGVVSAVVGASSRERQATFVQHLFLAFLDGKVEAITGNPTSPGSFSLLDPNAPESHKNLILLFSAPLISIQKETRLPPPDLSSFLVSLLRWSVNDANNDLQTNSAVHVLASIVNKHVEDATIFISANMDSFWTSDILNLTSRRRERALRASIWITRALLVRDHPSTRQYVDRLFSLFDDEELSWSAAKAVGQIVGGDDVLTKKNCAVVKRLASQKFLSEVLPKIIEGSKDNNGARRQTANLVALSSLIASVPKSMYSHSLLTITPLLLRGLELPDLNIRTNVIKTLYAIAMDETPGEPGVISTYASTIVTALLRNCMVDEAPSAKLREASLKCIGVLPRAVRYDILHPHKLVVIKKLAKALDDPKRDVRREAVDARSNWYSCNG